MLVVGLENSWLYIALLLHGEYQSETPTLLSEGTAYLIFYVESIDYHLATISSIGLTLELLETLHRD